MKFVSAGPLRPTTAKVREALFSILAPRVAGAAFLDLYAGVGSVGLEAWRNGAARLVMVEKTASTVRILLDNVRSEKAEAEVLQRDSVAALKTLQGPFDVIFLDPPYGTVEVQRCLVALGTTALLGPEGIVVAEHHHKDVAPEQAGALRRYRVQKYGETVLSFYRVAEDEPFPS